MKKLKKTPESCRGVKHDPREVLRCHERGRHGRQGTRRRGVEDRGIAYTRLLIYRPNSTRNDRSDSRKPSSVNTTDFVLLTGSVMYPFSCSRLMTSQSKPFQVRQPS